MYGEIFPIKIPWLPKHEKKRRNGKFKTKLENESVIDWTFEIKTLIFLSFRFFLFLLRVLPSFCVILVFVDLPFIMLHDKKPRFLRLSVILNATGIASCYLQISTVQKIIERPVIGIVNCRLYIFRFFLNHWTAGNRNSSWIFWDLSQIKMMVAIAVFSCWFVYATEHSILSYSKPTQKRFKASRRSKPRSREYL